MDRRRGRRKETRVRRRGGGRWKEREEKGERELLTTNIFLSAHLLVHF
jgi:hypothetical protein